VSTTANAAAGPLLPLGMVTEVSSSATLVSVGEAPGASECGIRKQYALTTPDTCALANTLQNPGGRDLRLATGVSWMTWKVCGVGVGVW
jgi:hypothetical protein